MKEHIHKWEPIGNNKVVCNSLECNLVSDIPTLLKNAIEAAATQARTKLLTDQLYARELKKDAHAKYYYEVTQSANYPKLEKFIEKQAVLL